MLLDACHYARGKFQGGAAGLTVDARLAAVTHRFHKGFQFSAQRLDRWRGQLLIREFRLWGRFFRGDAQGVAPGVIERNVLVLLEKAHLAHALGRYAARGHIGHRASLKFQASVRDIDFVRQHRDSDRLHFRDRLLYQGEQDVEVVDHQVVDHVDIEAARRKHTQPVDLEKERMIQNRLDRQHRWVESFDVADLQQALMPLCRVQQRIRLRQSLRHGLLDQNIEAHFHKAAANLSMLGGGHGHADGIGSAAQLVERGEGMGPKFGGGSLRAFSAFVEDADQFGVLNFAVNARVIPPEFTGSDNSDTYLSRLRCRRHSLFIPGAVSFGSAADTARGTAWMAIPAASANSINFVRSNTRVRPASTARAVACAFFMSSMVGRPMTGTSKRISCPGLLTFTTTSGLPSAIRAARAMVSSVPSTAPISASVLLRGRENSSLANFQSGRMELKILLCLTCPAITACVTPSWCIKSIALLNSPRLTQCSRFVERSSSGAASSFSAITAISIPWLRAPSRTRNGNRPLPAIRPHPAVLVSVLAMSCVPKRALLHNSAFRRLDETN